MAGEVGELKAEGAPCVGTGICKRWYTPAAPNLGLLLEHKVGESGDRAEISGNLVWRGRQGLALKIFSFKTEV